MLSELLQLISQCSIVEGIEDNMLWKFDSSGNCSAKSFSLQVYKLVTSFSSDQFHIKSMERFSPPKAELLA